MFIVQSLLLVAIYLKLRVLAPTGKDNDEDGKKKGNTVKDGVKERF